jgi:hypothetical protein
MNVQPLDAVRVPDNQTRQGLNLSLHQRLPHLELDLSEP